MDAIYAIRTRRQKVEPAGEYPRLRPARPTMNTKPAPEMSATKKTRTAAASKVTKSAAKKNVALVDRSVNIVQPKPIAGPRFTRGYLPTTQPDGLHRFVRGNAPGNMSGAEWAKAYNNADSRLRRGGDMPTEIAEEQRLSGRTREMAVKRLIEEGKLPERFVDNDV